MRQRAVWERLGGLEPLYYMEESLYYMEEPLYYMEESLYYMDKSLYYMEESLKAAGALVGSPGWERMYYTEASLMLLELLYYTEESL